ncbi:MAG: hypothetical protein MRY74_00020 [Neomegalonema sp.]|nr:hypothetical protein [Neomegalonema sp.]
MRALLIDGDILCRRAAHGAAAELGAPEAEMRSAVRRLEDALGRLRTMLRGDLLLAAVGCGASFRRQIDPHYKRARLGRRVPASLEAVRDRLGELVETRSAPELEADDLLGVWATAPDLSFAARPGGAIADARPAERLIVSADKDLLSIPGLHGAATGRVWRVSPAEAEMRHLAQTLIGDSSDGYRGCPGVGPKRAIEILSCNAADPWRGVVAAFQRAGLGPGEALIQARLARVLRHGEVDPDAGAPVLWSPSRLRSVATSEQIRRAVEPFLPASQRQRRLS